MTSPFDVLTNAGLVLGYAVSTLFALIFLVMGIQGASQLGFDLARWIADHDSAISMGVGVVLIVSIADVVLVRRRHFNIVLIGILINSICLFAILYAAFLADHKIRTWSLLFTAINPFWLSFGLGYQSAQYAIAIDTRRYDVWLEREQLSNVRLIRLSSSGIFYMQDKGGFIDSGLLLPPCRRQAELQDANHATQIGSHIWSTI
jgi:hypothetical protein